MPIIALSDDQQDKLIEFLTRFDINKRSKDYWRNRLLLWWDKNPSFTAKDVKGWILIERGEIVGFIGNIPLHFQLSGKKLKVYAGTTWNVDKPYRNKSISLLFKSLEVAKETILFSTTAGGDIEKINKTLNYRQLVDEEVVGYSFIVIKIFRYLRQKWSKYSMGFIFACIFSPILKLIQSYKLINQDFQKVKNINFADSRFDDLWNRTKHIYGTTNIRTSEIINWYCFNSEPFKKMLFGYFDNDLLYGYAIFINKDKVLKELELVDLWIDPTKKNTVNQLLNYSVNYGLKNGFDRVIFPHWSPGIINHLKKMNYFRSRSKQIRRYYKANSEIINRLHDHDSYFVGLQGDYGL